MAPFETPVVPPVYCKNARSLEVISGSVKDCEGFDFIVSLNGMVALILYLNHLFDVFNNHVHYASLQSTQDIADF